MATYQVAIIYINYNEKILAMLESDIRGEIRQLQSNHLRESSSMYVFLALLLQDAGRQRKL